MSWRHAEKCDSRSTATRHLPRHSYTHTQWIHLLKTLLSKFHLVQVKLQAARHKYTVLTPGGWTSGLCGCVEHQDENDEIFRKEQEKQLQKPTEKDQRRGQYFRFNVEFEGREPRLDDPTRMQELKDIAGQNVNHSSSKQLDHLARCVIAELFYFELEGVPRK